VRAQRSLPELQPTRAPTLPLGRAVPALAVLGLFVLLFCTLPAIAEHRRLLDDHARLQRETHAIEERLARWRRETRDAWTLGYLRMLEAKRLAWNGQRYLETRDAELAAAAAARTKRP